MSNNKKGYFVLAKIDLDQRKIYNEERIRSDYPEVIIANGNSNGKIHAINRGLATAPHFDILCNHSDDMWFVRQNFDELIRLHCGADDFVHFPDQVVGEAISTYSIMGVDYFKRFGYVYHPAYKNLWCDNEATAVAKALGRYKFVNEQILEHRHPMWGYGKKDILLKKTEATYYADGRVFERRKAINFGL